MSDVILSLSDEPPSVPRADFGFEIDFRRDAGPASRVFAATHQFIKACEALDSELVQLIDSSIQTVLVLEDIESGSIKTWLRSVLTSADDDALEKLDWKPLVGAYLVRAKYAVIRWVDKDQSLDELRGEIQRIAAETDVRRLPAYAPPSVPALIKAAKDFQAVKDRLVDGDRAKLLTGDGELEMNLSVRMSLDNILALAIANSIKQAPAEMILPVSKPDYLGDSDWELRRGDRTIAAKIQDVSWLARFQKREIDVRPGDALRCRVEVRAFYGFDNELIGENFSVLEVLDVLPSGHDATERPAEERRRS